MCINTYERVCVGGTLKWQRLPGPKTPFAPDLSCAPSCVKRTIIIISYNIIMIIWNVMRFIF